MKSREENLADLLVQTAQNIPDGIKKAFVKRSVDDAKDFIVLTEKDGCIDLQKLSFLIYKAYSLGAALYNDDRLINSLYDKEENLDKDDTSAI